MAGIDKTYITKEQYIEARKFWMKTYAKQVKELGHAVWLYPFSAFKDVEEVTPQFLRKNTADIDNFGSVLWNTSSVFDLWLMKNCPLDFVQARLHEQYDENYWGFKYKNQFNFFKKSFILSAHDSKGNKNVDLYFYQELKKDRKNFAKIEFIDKIIFYGTTFMYKFLQDIYKSFSFADNETLEVRFEYYGLKMINRGKKTFVYNEDETETEINLPYIYEDNVKEFFNVPEIKHSYKVKECKDYPAQAIYLSTETEIFDISAFKNYDKTKIGNMLLSLPKYVEEQIVYK